MAMWYALGIAFFAAIGTFLFVSRAANDYANESLIVADPGLRYRYRDNE